MYSLQEIGVNISCGRPRIFFRSLNKTPTVRSVQSFGADLCRAASGQLFAL
jgi:hypothetical protein